MFCLLPAAAGLLVATLWAGSVRGAAPPRAITQTETEYPAWARGTGIATEVALRVLIGRDGRVRDVHVIPYDVKHDILTRQMRASFDSAAVRAVRRWVFRPASRGGRRVAASLVIHVPFEDPGDARPVAAEKAAAEPLTVIRGQGPVGPPPRIVERVSPVYPDAAAGTGLVGEALVEVHLSPDALPTVVGVKTVLRGRQPIDSHIRAAFDSAAVQAARRWRFAWADGDTLRNWRRQSSRFLFLPPEQEMGAELYFGRVIHADDETPVDFTYVMVIGTRIGTYTDSMGRFLLEGLRQGRHKLWVVCILCERTGAEVDFACRDLGTIRVVRRNPTFVE